MEIATAALVGITLATGLTTAGSYVIGRAAGIRLGHRQGRQDAYAGARELLGAELLESGQRLTITERTLAATRAELHRLQDLRSRERRQAAEALEETTLRLDEIRTLNAGHAALLSQCATNLELSAATWGAMSATRKAGDARTNAHQLRELAGSLQPERQEVAA